eukprot:3016312-Pleurochrysis_carterae.AAC.2
MPKHHSLSNKSISEGHAAMLCETPERAFSQWSKMRWKRTGSSHANRRAAVYAHTPALARRGACHAAAQSPPPSWCAARRGGTRPVPMRDQFVSVKNL